MKLASFDPGDGERIGAVVNDRLIDLTAAGFGDTLKDVLTLGPEVFIDIAKSIDGKNGEIVLGDVTLLPPITKPGKILAIGMNYLAHIKEMGREPPKTQVWFNKQWNAANGPHADIQLPSAAPSMVDWEVELCVVIGHACRHVPAERAHEVIAGYMVGNDVSVRDWQMASPTMMMGKGFATHAPMGPWLTTADEVPNPQDIGLRCLVNGTVMQEGRTSDMVFTIAQQIEHLTKAFPLDPGDVIFTGTPHGVGAGRSPQVFLKEGDVVRVEADGLGSLEATLINEVAETLIL